ncbi:MAG: CinA family protein [Nevskia sp.]|nr:CinA family protein [Nevskia sp.]
MDTVPSDAALQALARTVGERLAARGEWLATAESCTGGLIAKLLTDIAGSSRWFERGAVTYSNLAKQQLLGVTGDVLQRSGAVSAETVQAMAQGLLARAPVQWTLAVSGVAGPDGGSTERPVGTVWIAWSGTRVASGASRFLFAGDRDAVRRRSAEAALRGLLDLVAAAPA